MKSIYTFIMVFLSGVAIAQESSTYPDQIAATFTNMDIDGQYVVATDRCEQIWSSKNGGVTWNQEMIDDAISLYDVKLIPGETGKAIVGAFRNLYLYDFDEGIIQEFSSDPLFEFQSARKIFVDGNEIMAVTSEGVHKATAGVYEWESMMTYITDDDYILEANMTDRYIYIGTNVGKIFQLDKNTLEVVEQNFVDDKVREIVMVTDEIGYGIFQANQSLLKTTDGWETYFPLENMTERISPRAYGEDILLTVNTNRIYRSTDGGMSSEWITTANTPEFALTENAMFDEDGTLYLMGRGSMLMKSEDYGLTFEAVNPYRRTTFNDVDINEAGVGYTVGEYGSVIKTEDHGYNWEKLTTSIAAEEYISDVIAMSDDQYILGSSEGIYVMNGSQQQSFTEGGVLTLHADVNGQYIIAIVESDNGYAINRSTDGGLTWTFIVDGLQWTGGISQDEDGTLFIGRQADDTTLRSTDDGLTWEAQSYGLAFRAIASYGQIMLGSVGNQIYKSTDGGENWELTYSVYAIGNLNIIDENHYMFVSPSQNETQFYETTDGGETWSRTHHFCFPTNGTFINKNNDVILAQDNGHINIAALQVINTSTDETTIGEPVNIYPNPIASGSALSIDSNWDKVVINSLNGEVILSLNQYTQSIPTQDMTAGMYMVQVTSEGKSTIQKLIVY